jgi:hypothetical protein
MDRVAFEDDHLMARAGDGERRRKAGDAASGDDELHLRKVTGGRKRRRPVRGRMAWEQVLMELGGLEPPTSWVRSRRSPN